MADLKKEILKKLDRFQYSRGRREVFLQTRGASRPNSGDSIKL